MRAKKTLNMYALNNAMNNTRLAKVCQAKLTDVDG